MNRFFRSFLALVLALGQPGVVLAGSNPASPNIFSFAGNPNGNLACYTATVGQSPPDMAWDTVDLQMFTCTTTGTTSTAVWTRTSAPLSVVSSSATVPLSNSSGTIDPSYLGNVPTYKQAIDNGTFQVAQRGTYFSNINSAAATTIVLGATGANTWNVPSNWNNGSNTICVVGTGAGGQAVTGGGGGGGGGAFACRNNVTLSGTMAYTIAAGGAPGASAGYSFANATSYSGVPSSTVVAAAGGSTASGASGGAGGSSAASSGTTTYSGGAGGNGSDGGPGGAGGGGAGGPSIAVYAADASSTPQIESGTPLKTGSGGSGGHSGATGGSPQLAPSGASVACLGNCKSITSLPLVLPALGLVHNGSVVAQLECEAACHGTGSLQLLGGGGHGFARTSFRLGAKGFATLHMTLNKAARARFGHTKSLIVELTVTATVAGGVADTYVTMLDLARTAPKPRPHHK